ncbi:MAG: hypothetical protein SGJ01_08585 [Gemmatimonadota bacterium]|nr:hypothetical protein [Gemmatimonadota bacterium]
MALSFRQCTIKDAELLALLVEEWIRVERRLASRPMIRAGLARFLGDDHQGHGLGSAHWTTMAHRAAT